MKSVQRWLILWFVCVFSVFLFFVANAQAVEIPFDKKVYTKEEGLVKVHWWRNSEGKGECIGYNMGNISNAVSILTNVSMPNAGETLVEYANRIFSQVFNRHLTEQEQAMCNALGAENSIEYIVERFRQNLTRPVKRIDTNADGIRFVNKDINIGRIEFGKPCTEKEIESFSSPTWHEVVITYPDGSKIIGATVCEQKL